MSLSRISREKVVQTYMIVDREGGAGYNVELTDAVGVNHTILGFETKAEAQVWIEQDQKGSIGAAQVPTIASIAKRFAAAEPPFLSPPLEPLACDLPIR